MVIFLLISLVIIFFEVSLREIALLNDICLLFISIDLLFWFKRYKISIICGLVSGFFVDILLQNHLGQSLLALYGPLFILTFFDNLLRIDSNLSRTLYLVVSVSFSIFISNFLFELLFWRGELIFAFVIRRIVISVVISLLASLIFGKFLLAGEDRSKKYL